MPLKNLRTSQIDEILNHFGPKLESFQIYQSNSLLQTKFFSSECILADWREQVKPPWKQWTSWTLHHPQRYSWKRSAETPNYIWRYQLSTQPKLVSQENLTCYNKSVETALFTSSKTQLQHTGRTLRLSSKSLLQSSTEAQEDDADSEGALKSNYDKVQHSRVRSSSRLPRRPSGNHRASCPSSSREPCLRKVSYPLCQAALTRWVCDLLQHKECVGEEMRKSRKGRARGARGEGNPDFTNLERGYTRQISWKWGKTITHLHLTVVSSCCRK